MALVTLRGAPLHIQNYVNKLKGKEKLHNEQRVQ